MADPSLSRPASGEKILFVTPVAPWHLFGGTPTVSRNLIDLLSAALELEVCCLRSNEAGTYPCTKHGAHILTGAVRGLSRRLKFFFDWSDASFAHRQFDKSAVRQRFAALIAAKRPEVIIFDHIYSSWLIDLVPGPATKITYIAHDDMVAYADSLLRLQPGLLKRLRFTGLRAQYRALQEKVLRRCDHTLAMTAEDAARLAPTSRGLVELAPLFFDFSEAPREYSSEFHSLLITGSFDTWEKKLGLTRFLESVFVPLRQRSPGLRLVIAGGIPDDVRGLIPMLSPPVEIVQAPSAARMKELVRDASTAVVLDLQASGLKIKTTELAAAGLPLVSWAAGLEGTGLVHERDCLLAESPVEFVSHLDRLFSESDLRRRLGAAARSSVHARFSRDAARSQLRTSRWFAEIASGGVTHAASQRTTPPE